MTKIRKKAATGYSTEGLLDSLLNILGSTNDILGNIDDVEIEIHEAKAEGEPVSSGANDVISLLDDVRGNFEEARNTLIKRLDVLVGKGTPEKPLLPEESIEEGEEEELLDEE